MFLLNTVRVCLLAILVVSLQVQTLLTVPEYEIICDDLTKDPSFSEEMVIGKKWRAYHTCNLPAKRLDELCVEISFKRAHPMTIDIVKSTMRPYLRTEPNWSEATLLMKMSPGYYRNLLIPDPSGVAGRYHDVTFIGQQRAKAIKPFKNEVEVCKFAFKLFREGRYLVFTDCSTGVSFLLHSQDENAPKPDRKEMRKIARTVDLGHCSSACGKE